MNIEEMVNKAQLEIAAILARLEKEAGVVVDSVDVRIDYSDASTGSYIQNTYTKDVYIQYKRSLPVVWCCD